MPIPLKCYHLEVNKAPATPPPPTSRRLVSFGVQFKFFDKHPDLSIIKSPVPLVSKGLLDDVPTFCSSVYTALNNTSSRKTILSHLFSSPGRRIRKHRQNVILTYGFNSNLSLSSKLLKINFSGTSANRKWDFQ